VGLRAAELVPDVAVFEATMNRDHLRRGLELLRATGGASAPDVPDLGEAFGESEDKITHAVDVAGELDRKRRAMAAHASQIAETSFFLSLPEPAFVAGFGTEWFISRRDPSGGRTTLDDLASSAPAPT
jgi:LmbE family N-acetylglucosaminyl deacetylase